MGFPPYGTIFAFNNFILSKPVIFAINHFMIIDLWNLENIIIQ